MSFKLTELAGTAVLVEGKDVRGTEGTEILDNSQWEDYKRRNDFDDALALVDEAIAALVAPITDAVKAANKKLAVPALDPLFYVVDNEETEHVSGQPRQITKLNRDSILLRAIEQGQEDRLIWVNDELVVTKAPVVTAPVDDTLF